MTTTVTPQPPLAAPGKEELHGEIEALCQLVKLGQGHFTLALVEYDLPRACAGVLAHLREQFPDLNVVEAELSPPPPDAPLTYTVLDQLKKIVQASSPNKPPDALLLTGLETLFPHASEDDQISDEQHRALQPLNLGRNLLAEEFPCPVLIFLPKAAMEVVLTSAPDFVSWKSGFFTFESDLDKVRAELSSEADVEVGWLDYRRLRRLPFHELLRQIIRLKALIADARALPAEPLTVARLHNRLGWAALASDNSSDARKSFAEMLRLAREANDAKLIKAAEKGSRKAEKLASKRRGAIKRGAVSQRSFHGAAALSQADGLFGRDAELQELLLQITQVGNRFVTVWGETGCGKTSLVLAGIVPELEKQAHLSVVVREWEHPNSAIRTAIEKACAVSLPDADSLKGWIQAAADKTGKTIAVVCDQFEQFFTKHPRRQDREPLLKAIGACLNDFRLPCRFIFILREDYLGRMVELEKYVGDALDKTRRYYLNLFDQTTALRVMRQLAGNARRYWPDVFLNEVIKDLTHDGQVRPIDLQLTGAALVTLDINDEQAYSRPGRAEGLLLDYLQATLESISDNKRELRDLKRILLVLIEEPHKRLALTAEEIAFRLETNFKRTCDELDKLSNVNLVYCYAESAADTAQAGEIVFRYELMHDVLIDSVLRLTRDLQDNRRLAGKILTRAQEDVGIKPRHTISLREQRLLRNFLPAEKKDDPKVKALLNRSLFFGLTKWITYVVLLPLAILIFIQSTFTHITLEQDFNDRIVIRRGLPQLGFLPLIGNKILIDTGLTGEALAPEKRSAVQEIYFWALDNRSGGAIAQAKFYENFRSPVEQGEFLCRIGHKAEGLSKWLDALKNVKDSTIRYGAADGLATAFRADPSLAGSTFEPLLTLFTDDQNKEVRLAAAGVLSLALKADPSLAGRAFEPLFASLKKDKDRDVRCAAASGLTNAIKANPSLAGQFFDPLFAFLKEEKDDYVLDEAVKTLNAVFTANPDLAARAFVPLSTALKDSKDYSLINTMTAGIAAAVEANSSLATQDFGTFLTILQQKNAADFGRSIAVRGLTAAIKADRLRAGPAFGPLLTIFKDDKDGAFRRMAARGLIEALKADRSLARRAFEPLFASLKRDKDRNVRRAAASGLINAIKADHSLAGPALMALLAALIEETDSQVCREIAAWLAAAIEVNLSLAERAFEPLLSMLLEDKGHFMAAKVLAETFKANKLLAKRAFEPLLNTLLENKKSQVRYEAARGLAFAIKADHLLAERAFEPLLIILKKDSDAAARSAVATVLAFAITANPSLIERAFEPLLVALKEDTDSSVRRAAAEALEDCITLDEKARNSASRLFTDYDITVRQCMIQGFAEYLASRATEEAEKGRDPVQFLFNQFEGKQSWMSDGNAITHAVYRKAVEGALARGLASKKPEAFRQRLEEMRDHDTRLYLRMVAWDLLAANTVLPDKQEMESFGMRAGGVLVVDKGPSRRFMPD